MEKTLNLHQGFGQCGEALDFKVNLFPAGECYLQIDVPHGVHSCRINSRVNNSDDLMNIIFAVDALKRRGVRDIELFIPYFPYARQDRVCDTGEAFSLKVICKILESLNLYRIISYDIHSNVAGLMLDDMMLVDYDNFREVLDFIEYLDISKSKLALICPDNGARKKAEALYNKGMFDTVIYCNKRRTESGIVVASIENMIEGMTAIVVDDICDGGATFNALGQRLQEAKVKESYLFVSHGIFSKGFAELSKYYKRVGTTNSRLKDYHNSYVKSFNLNY